ncbi:MAG: hypothetical protein CL677_08670 [Bdellovibrionaceae bacterium]|nr:hypothetical protein [Pseudobdellovibrionaceae bacterium]|tara:strand:+ start:243 stop:653 length:411 start_codon:yes stop_codon:yes gene_type:complete
MYAAEILILEDDDDIREMYVEAFEDLGCKVHECSSIEQALLKFNANKKIILGFVDYYTPGFITGYAEGEGRLAQAFKAREYFEFYFVTGSADLTEEQAQKIGAKGILRKPLPLEKLENVVQTEILKKKQIIASLAG